MIWRCPGCRGELAETPNGTRCVACGARYQSVDGILDLRLAGASWIDREADETAARRLLATSDGLAAEELVRRVFGSRPAWDDAHVVRRTRQVMAAPERLRRDVKGWLRLCVPPGGRFLDVGCGAGVLLAAAAGEGEAGIGIDVSLEWLIVAKRLIAAWGGRPVLAAALAEALPLADSAVESVISLDVIEHVGDPARYLKEIDRVTKPGGRLALSTPNRYSLAAEPHVSVWGVGWVPRPMQQRYVKWRSGKQYGFVNLLSAREVAHLLRRYTRFRSDFMVAPVPQEELDLFPAYRVALARQYNRLCRFRWARWLFLRIGPFFRVLGRKT